MCTKNQTILSTKRLFLTIKTVMLLLKKYDQMRCMASPKSMIAGENSKISRRNLSYLRSLHFLQTVQSVILYICAHVYQKSKHSEHRKNIFDHLTVMMLLQKIRLNAVASLKPWSMRNSKRGGKIVSFLAVIYHICVACIFFKLYKLLHYILVGMCTKYQNILSTERIFLTIITVML